MSRRTKQPQAASRRTRRAEQEAHASPKLGFDETQRVVSNPIFYCGGNGPSHPGGDRLPCVYGAGAVRALVHDPAAAESRGSRVGKPLPLPPCRAQHRGARVGHAVVAGGPHGRLLRRRVHHLHHLDDPFLAAYVACSKGSGGENGAQPKPQQRKKKNKNKASKSEKVEVVRRCGTIWNGWAAGARYAGAAMSCKNGCAVVDVRARNALAKEEAKSEENPAGPTLDLSWAPAVLSARAIERRREQR